MISIYSWEKGTSVRDKQRDWSNTQIRFGDFQVFSEGANFNAYTNKNILYQYWKEKGGLEQIVSRKDINPADLKPVLRHIVIMDVFPGQSVFTPEELLASARHTFNLNVRLIGTFVADFYGEITGKDVYQMQHAPAANRIYHMASLVRESRAPQFSMANGYTDGKEHLKAYGLYLPLYEPNHDSEIVKILVYVDVVTLDDYAL
jgi:hypothetical protein